MKLYHRSKFAQTAFALNGVPSWNRIPVRRLNDHTRPPFEAFHDLASDGTTVVVPGLRPTRPSVSWSMTFNDGPSETTAPSSEVGSATEPKTSVSPAVASVRLVAASVAAVAVRAMTTVASSTFSALRIVLLCFRSFSPPRYGEAAAQYDLRAREKFV